MSEPDTAAERARELLRGLRIKARQHDTWWLSRLWDLDILLDAALRAAEAGARRATLLECARWHDARYVALRDNGPKGQDGLVTDIVGGHMAAHYESAEHFLASAPAAASPWQEIEVAAQTLVRWWDGPVFGTSGRISLNQLSELRELMEALRSALPSPPAS